MTTSPLGDRWIVLVILIALLALVLCLARPAHAQVTVVDQILARQKIVAGTTTPAASGSPLTVVGLPGSGDLLRVGAGGSIGLGLLGVADIPSVFTRRDLNEPISGLWTFAGGSLAFTNATSNYLLWPAGALNTPTLTTRSVGTRMVFYPLVGAGNYFDYASGASPSTLWWSVPDTTHRFAWFANDLDANTEPADQDLVAELTGTRNFLPGVNYAGNLGAITRKWLTLHAAELWVETLVAQNTIATIGGRVLVGHTTTLTEDLPAATGTSTIFLKHNQPALGDSIYLEANGQFEVMVIGTAVTGPYPDHGNGYSYIVYRNLDGSGANAWTAGDAVFNTGTVGTSWIDLYALSSMKGGTEAGPTIVGNVRTADTNFGTGANYNAWAPRWAIGNLQGLYGYTGATYGSAFGNPSSTWVAVDATNGFRVVNGAQTIGQWDTAGVVTIGSAAANQTGLVRIDGDSLDMQYRGSDGVLRTPFTIYNSGSTGIAQFNAATFTNAGLFSPSVGNLTGSLTLAVSNTNTHVQVDTTPSGSFRPTTDIKTPLGDATHRWANIHLNLPGQSATGFGYVVTNDAADATRLGFYCGYTGAYYVNSVGCPSGVATAWWQCGVMTSITCNP